MKCLIKYQWVKLPRDRMPEGKDIMGTWAKLASRAAFRAGMASYCGYNNAVTLECGQAALLGSKIGTKKPPKGDGDASGA